MNPAHLNTDSASHQHSFSVIIPVLNEADGIGQLLDYLFGLPGFAEHAELIVVDGGSRDDTRNIAERYPLRVVQSPAGRSKQMNMGAEVAGTGHFFFLHADSYPPGTFVQDVLSLIEQHTVGGCYRLAFDDPHPVLRLYAWFTRFDVQAFRYGDQGLYVPADMFNAFGGFNEKYLVMEDNDLVKRLRAYWRWKINAQPAAVLSQAEKSNVPMVSRARTDSRQSQAEKTSTKFILQHQSHRKPRKDFIILPDAMTTSARRYHDNGILRLQLVFAAIYLLHNAGIPHDELRRFYKDWISGRPV